MRFHLKPGFFYLSVGVTSFIKLTFLCFILFNSLSANANEFNNHDSSDLERINSLNEIGQGALLFKHADHYSQAAQLKIDVDISVTGMINRTKVLQSFSNTTDQWQEGIYVFPLPENAAVDRMRLKIGERIIEGQIKEKQEAKKTYEKAKQQGKQVALTEQERPNIFTTSVANIAPGETVRVEIEYQQIIEYDNGVFSLRFPMVVGPRYIPGKQRINGFSGSGWALNTDEVPDAARITPPVLQPGNQRKNEVTISINLDAGLELEKIESPYHQIEIIKNTGQYIIRLKQETILANRDFELIWKPIPSVAPKAALFTEKFESDTYAMIMMMPPTVEESVTLDREIIYVIDTSGSMGGQSIIQAKSALELALTRLKPDDRFNIIQFNSFTSQLFKHSEPVTSSSLLKAKNYIQSLDASGGTEMATALRAALSSQTDNHYLRQIIFLTDGSIGNEQALFEIIQKQLGNSRLFTIGIGSAPNSHFMQRAANFGRGTHTYIGKLDEVQSRMQTLFEKIEKPVLKDIHIDWGQNVNIETWPNKINDLYQGEPFLITAKAKNLPESIHISGQITKQNWSSILNLNGGQDRKGISALWARNKIAALMEQKRDAEFDSIKQIIIETALKFHLVSKYTSLVAVDVTPIRPENESLDTHAIPTHLPEGWDYNKVFGQAFPTTATDARLNFLIGLILMLLTFLFYLTHRHESHVN